jgi:protein TonB
VLADVEASQATPALAADSTLVAEIGPDAVGSGEALLVEESLVAQLPPEQSPSDASLAAEASFSAVNRQIDIAAALGMAVPADEPVAAAEIGPQFVFNARQSVPLSELEFTKYVEPKYPRDRQRQSIRTRPYNGWMDKYPRGGQGQSIRNQVYNGWVDVEFRVGTDGRPRNVEIIGSDLPTRFESPSLTAVNKWRFKPYEHDGEAVAVYSAARLRFEN